MFKKNRTALFLSPLPLVVALLTVLSYSIYSEQSLSRKNIARKILSAIPEEDRFALDAFFGFCSLTVLAPIPYLVINWRLRFIASVSHPKNGNCGRIRFSNLNPAHVILRKGWKVWEKHSHHFPSKRFILHRFNDRKEVLISIINRSACKNAIGKHENHFLCRCGTKISSEEL